MKFELERFLDRIGVRIAQDQKTRIERYKNLLLDVSENLNLVSSKDLSILEEHHFADCLAPLDMIPAGSRVADWGSGGGLPGIPISIMRPDVQITLVESRQKKASFLIRAINELSLRNTQVFAYRGESLADFFDLITVRAVGQIHKEFKKILPHLSSKGAVLFYKGPKLEEELDQARKIISAANFTFRIKEVTIPSGRQRKYLLLSK